MLAALKVAGHTLLYLSMSDLLDLLLLIDFALKMLRLPCSMD